MSKEKTKKELTEENAVAHAEINRLTQERAQMLELDKTQRKEFTTVLAFPMIVGVNHGESMYSFGVRRNDSEPSPLTWPEIFAHVGRIQAEKTQLERYKNIDSTIEKVNMLMQDFEARKKHRHDSCD